MVLTALAVVFPVRPIPPRQGLAASSTPLPPMATATATATSRAPTATPQATPIAEPVLPRHYVVLVVVDGGRPSYLTLTRLPHIQALMRQGVVYDRAWVGELESSTPNVHVTFGTGTLPRENGFLGFGWAAPQTRRTVDFRTLLANGAIDPVLQALPVPSVAARLHRLMPHAVSVAASGHKDYAVVGLGGGAATYELYGKFVNRHIQPAFMHSPPPLSPAELQGLTVPSPLKPGAEDSWGVQYAMEVVRRVRPRLLMINLPDLDTWGHWYGPGDTAAFRQLILNVDRCVGEIEDTYRQLGIFRQTDFIFTADHSMMESRAETNWRDVDRAAAAVGASVVRKDGEGGSVWLQNPAQARAVAQRLVAMRPDHVEAIFYRSAPGLTYSYTLASPLSWVADPRVVTALADLVDTTAGRDGPDLWVLYRENYTVVPRNVQGVWKGTHGGATWNAQHVPLIMAGPGIRQGVHSSFPARAIDITPTIEYLLGLSPVRRDGVLLADALASPSKGEQNAQNALAPSLDADVRALQAQSQADVRLEAPWPGPIKGIVPCNATPGLKSPLRPCHISLGAPTDG